MCLYVQSVPLRLGKTLFPLSGHRVLALVYMWVPTPGQKKMNFSAQGCWFREGHVTTAKTMRSPLRTFCQKFGETRNLSSADCLNAEVHNSVNTLWEEICLEILLTDNRRRERQVSSFPFSSPKLELRFYYLHTEELCLTHELMLRRGT